MGHWAGAAKYGWKGGSDDGVVCFCTCQLFLDPVMCVPKEGVTNWWVPVSEWDVWYQVHDLWERECHGSKHILSSHLIGQF